jgi:aminoglycoside phosphotransferase (APT) family kinase protein
MSNDAPPWTAERTVSPELARDLIEKQFPELAPVRAESPSEGWDNIAYLVNGTYIFRFPRRTIAVDLIRTEAKVLPVIAPRLPLSIPVPVFLGHPDERFPWPFAGYRRISGETACRADLDEEQRIRAAEPLARFLSALHQVPVEEAERAGAGPDTLGRTDVERRRAMCIERLDSLRTKGLLDDIRPLRTIAEAMPSDLPPGGRVLVHGDFYVRHVLVDGRGLPCGVIDWGDVHLGDPALDLSIAHGFLPPAARGAFRAAYGPIPEGTWRMARFRALFMAVVLLLYGADVGDAALVREARTDLRNVIAQSA